MWGGVSALDPCAVRLLVAVRVLHVFLWRAFVYPAAYLSNPRTEFTPEGQRLYLSFVSRDYVDMPKLIFGNNYIVIEPVDNEYFTFPHEPASTFSTFRHAWVIVHKKLPVVPVLEVNKFLGLGDAPEDSATYCSICFKPWSLWSDPDDVPFLPSLGFSIAHRAARVESQPSTRRRISGKQHAAGLEVRAPFVNAFNRPSIGFNFSKVQVVMVHGELTLSLRLAESQT